MDLTDKLEILADAAKYDASCASSGAPKRSSEGKDGIGTTSGTNRLYQADFLLRSYGFVASASQQMNLWTEPQAA
jgi:predicted DNA-binding helix-hairpin-helix protein